MSGETLFPAPDRRTEIEVPNDLYAQMKAWADAEGVSVDEIADRALREYLDLEEDQSGDSRSTTGEK